MTEPFLYYETAAYPCSYLNGRIARSQVVAPAENLGTDEYSELIRQGFRRSGSFIYRPDCVNCAACTPIRVPVSEFKPNRSQMRAWKQHSALSATVLEPAFVTEHFALYTRYQKLRHSGGGMDVEDEAAYTNFLVNSNVRTYMVEFRESQPDNPANPLKMVSVIDQLVDGISAVYTFYDAVPQQSLGTFNVLWQIQLAESLGLPYVYLGYWIEASGKMAYKSRYKPHEVHIDQRWQRIGD